MTQIAFHLPEPKEVLLDFKVALEESLTRPLDDEDYYQAARHPKDIKVFDNTMTMGVSYFVRHAKRCRAQNDMRGTRYNAFMVAICVPGYLLNLGSINLLAGGITLSRLCFPAARRSELATRENSIAISICEYAMIVGSFAQLRQYHSGESKRPFIASELKDVSKQSQMMIERLREYVSFAPPRIRYSELLPKKIKFLEKRHNDLVKRISREERLCQ